MNKELRRLVKRLEAQGFACRVTRNGHIVVSHNGRRVATLSGTPSDHRSWKNQLAALRRAGYQDR